VEDDALERDKALTFLVRNAGDSYGVVYVAKILNNPKPDRKSACDFIHWHSAVKRFETF